MDPQRQEMTRLGLLGLIPFAASAIGVWLSPWIVSYGLAMHLQAFALIYGAVIIAYLTGVEGGAQFSSEGKHNGFLPGQLILLTALFAALPNGLFGLYLGDAWRHAVMLILLVFLMFRDLNAVAAGQTPRWYGALRMRLTFWAGLSMLAIISRLLLWGRT